MLKTIKEILAHEFVGYYCADAQSIKDMENFAEDTTNSIADRASAIRYMETEGMGMPAKDDSVGDEALVNEYMKAAVADMCDDNLFGHDGFMLDNI